MNDNSPNINRRTVLRTVGGISTASMIGLAAAEDEKNTTHTIELVEIGVRHHIEGNQNDELLYANFEGLPLYDVDSAQEKVTLFGSTPEEVERIFMNSKRIVHGVGISTPPAKGSDGEKAQTLTTELGPHKELRKQLYLANPYQRPKVTVTTQKDNFIVEAGEMQEELAAETRINLELQSKDVDAKVIQCYTKPDIIEGLSDKELGPKRVYGQETIQVRPIIEAVHHGTIEVKIENGQP